MYSVIYLSLGIVFFLKWSRWYCYLKKYENFKILKCLTCKMKLFISITKIVSFTFNLFFIPVIIIIIKLILTLIFSYIIWHLNFDCHPSQTVQAQQDHLYIQHTGTYLSKSRLPDARIPTKQIWLIYPRSFWPSWDGWVAFHSQKQSRTA